MGEWEKDQEQEVHDDSVVIQTGFQVVFMSYRARTLVAHPTHQVDEPLSLSPLPAAVIGTDNMCNLSCCGTFPLIPSFYRSYPPLPFRSHKMGGMSQRRQSNSHRCRDHMWKRVAGCCCCDR